MCVRPARPHDLIVDPECEIFGSGRQDKENNRMKRRVAARKRRRTALFIRAKTPALVPACLDPEVYEHRYVPDSQGTK